MHKSHYNKYDPKKDKLNINYEQYQKMKELEENKNFQNTNDFKFMFFYIPEEITKSVLGIRLSLIVKIVSLIYSYSSMLSLREQIAILSRENNINYINFILNALSIFTSIFIYFSMFKKSYSFVRFCYYVYVFHFHYKLIETIIYLFFNLSRKKYKIKSIFAIILGLSGSSIINFISTWLIFCYMVYIYNINNKEPIKKEI